MTLLDNNDIRYPISVLEQRNLHPANILFISAVENALADSKAISDVKARESLKDRLQDIRYYWVRYVSAVRMYMMNRSEVFGHLGSEQPEPKNRGIYLQVVDEGLSDVELHPQVKRDLALTADVEAMKAARKTFVELFEQTTSLCESDRWRADIPFFRDRIKPQFVELWDGVNAIGARMGIYASERLAESTSTAATLSL